MYCALPTTPVRQMVGCSLEITPGAWGEHWLLLQECVLEYMCLALCWKIRYHHVILFLPIASYSLCAVYFIVYPLV